MTDASVAHDWARWSRQGDPWARQRIHAQRALIEACVARAPPPGLFLDLGGGASTLAPQAEAVGYRAISVDLVSSDGIRGDFLRLPIRDGVARVTAFCASLHWAVDSRLALREARRVMQPNGVVAIALAPLHRSTTDADAAALTTRTAIRRAGGRGSASRSYRHLTYDDLQAALDAGHFVDTSYQRGVPLLFKGWRAMKAWGLRRPYADFPLVTAIAR